MTPYDPETGKTTLSLITPPQRLADLYPSTRCARDGITVRPNMLSATNPPVTATARRLAAGPGTMFPHLSAVDPAIESAEEAFTRVCAATDERLARRGPSPEVAALLAARRRPPTQPRLRFRGSGHVEWEQRQRQREQDRRGWEKNKKISGDPSANALQWALDDEDAARAHLALWRAEFDCLAPPGPTPPFPSRAGGGGGSTITSNTTTTTTTASSLPYPTKVPLINAYTADRNPAWHARHLGPYAGEAYVRAMAGYHAMLGEAEEHGIEWERARAMARRMPAAKVAARAREFGPRAEELVRRVGRCEQKVEKFGGREQRGADEVVGRLNRALAEEAEVMDKGERGERGERRERGGKGGKGEKGGQGGKGKGVGMVTGEGGEVEMFRLEL